MKKNNKGFMLAEVVVTSTLLLVIMISLFYTFNRIYIRYNEITKYKNIDGMYLLDNLTEYLLTTKKEERINRLLLEYDNNNINDDYIFLIDNKVCKMKDETYCNDIQKTYNINYLIIAKERIETINELITKKEYNQTFKDYFDYIKKYYAFDDNAKESNLIIVEYITDKENEEDSDKVYNYSSIELR